MKNNLIITLVFSASSSVFPEWTSAQKHVLYKLFIWPDNSNTYKKVGVNLYLKLSFMNAYNLPAANSNNPLNYYQTDIEPHDHQMMEDIVILYQKNISSNKIHSWMWIN